ncbi:MAG: nitroreductase family protein [Mangrovibacterium sp.]
MLNFFVNTERCTQCGLCAKDCPVLIIDGKTKYPEIKAGKEQNCLKCQHCLAICPSAAISILGKQPENSISTFIPNPESVNLGKLIQTRRSVRNFKSENIAPELIEELIHVASHAPTAKNENAVQFTVVDNSDEMAELSTATYQHINQAATSGQLAEKASHLANFAKVWDAKGINVIYRNAPHLLIFSAPVENTQPVADCCIAASYFELLANSHNIATLWNGFALQAFEGTSPKLKEKLGIPSNHVIAAVLSFGKAAVKYARSVQNDNPKIVKVNSKK